MVTIERVGELALSLPRVKQKACGDLIGWWVDNRLLARQLDADTVVIRADFEPRERLLADFPQTFVMHPRFEAHQMVVAELPAADETGVTRALHEAWSLQHK